jgi:hypothetical protein
MQFIEDVFFSSGMDRNNGPLGANKGSWTNAENIIVVPTQGGGDTYFGKAPKGNLLINNPLLQKASYIFHGFKFDPKLGYIYYALTKTSALGPFPKMYWFRYREDSGHELVLDSLKLNFISKQFTSIEIIDGNILYWVDPKFNSWLIDSNGNQRFGNPKRFLIDKALAYTQSGGTSPLGYPEIDDCCLDQCKWPPFYPPKVQFQTNEAKSISLIRNKSYQFAYRYLYDGKEISKPSPISDICFPINSESMNGTIYGNPLVDNEIGIQIDTGNHSVNFIDLLVREGNIGPWYLFKRIDKKALGLGNDAPYNAKYDGTQNLQAIPDEQQYSFDLVPDVATSQRFSQIAKTLIHAGIQEGYDKASFTKNSVTLVQSLYKKRKGAIGQSGIDYIDSTTQDDYYISWIKIVQPENLIPGDVITIRVNRILDDSPFTYSSEIYYISYTIKQEDIITGTTTEIAYHLYQNIILHFSPYKTILDYRFEFSFNELYGRLDITCSRVWDGTFVSIGYTQIIFNYVEIKERSLKDSDQHEWAVIYFRQGNKTNGATYDKLKTIVPSNPSADPGIFQPDQFVVTHALFNINEIPPEWATHCCIAKRERTATAAFMQTTVTTVYALEQQVKIFLDGYYPFAYVGASYNYTISKGDVVSLRTYVQKNPQSLTVGTLTQKWSNQQMQGIVQEYNEAENSIIVQGFDISNLQLQPGSIIQIAKPSLVSDTQPYYATSKFYEIINPNTPSRMHGGEDIDLRIDTISISENGFYITGNFSFLSSRTVQIIGTTSNNRTGICITTYDSTTNLTKVSFPGFPVLSPENEHPTTARLTAKLIQTSTLPAIWYYDKGDVWVRQRVMTTGVQPVGIQKYPETDVFVIESNFFSDFWDSRGWDRGFPFAYAPNAKQTNRINLIRSSQSIIAGTDTNGLSEFLPANSQEVGANEGPIVGTAIRGEALRVYQRQEVSTVIVGRTIATNPDNSEQYLLRSQVLGPVTPSRQGYGAWKEEAIFQLDSEVYFLDVLHGVFVKDTLGGMFNISGTMHAEIQALCKSIAEEEAAGNLYNIRMGYNQLTKELYMSVQNLALDRQYTLSYLPERGEWNGYYTFYSEGFGNLNSRLLSVKYNTAQVFEFNEGIVGEFFEEETPPMIEFFARYNPTEEKILRSVFIRTESKPKRVSVKGPATIQSPLGQETMCRLEKYEDGYLAVLMNNKLDPDYTDQAKAYIYGRQMRASYFTVKIEWESGALVNLKNVVLYYDVDRPASH